MATSVACCSLLTGTAPAIRGRGVAAPATARMTITRTKAGRTDSAAPGVPETLVARNAQIADVTTAMSGENRGSEATIVSDMVHRPGRGFAAGSWIPAGEVNVLL